MPYMLYLSCSEIHVITAMNDPCIDVLHSKRGIVSMNPMIEVTMSSIE